MAKHQGSKFMRLTSTFVVLLLLNLVSVSNLSAHGNEKHVMGTIKAVGTDSITVETTSHEVQTVQITSQTKFVRGASPSSLRELKVGDRVVIHAKPSGDRLEATEVKSAGASRNSAPAR